jgi:hypothetical protein
MASIFKSFKGVICVSVCLWLVQVVNVHAGGNLFTKNGVLSNLSEDRGSKSSSVRIELPPMSSSCTSNPSCTKTWQKENCQIKYGTDYAVKVNFLKVESATEVADAYFDWKRDQNKEKAGVADLTREAIKKVKSRAEMKVYDSSGNLVGQIQDLGAMTLGKRVTFIAKDTAYKVEINCLGSGIVEVIAGCHSERSEESHFL